MTHSRPRTAPRRNARLSTAFLWALGILALAPSSASAGDYVLRLCDTTRSPGTAGAVQHGYPAYSTQAYCDTAQGTGMRVTSVAQASRAQHRRWIWAVPVSSHMQIKQMATGSGSLRARNGHLARIIASNSDGSGEVPLAEAVGSQQRSLAGWSRFVDGTKGRVELRLECAQTTCSASKLEDVVASAKDISLTVRDLRAPGVSLSGSLVSDEWLGAKAKSVTVTPSDGESGIARSLVVNAGGGEQTLRDNRAQGACDVSDALGGFARSWRPCPTGTGAASTHSFTGAALAIPANSQRQIRFCAEDLRLGPAASSGGQTVNRGCQARTIKYDPTAPGAPVGLSVAGGEQWRPTNSFAVSWSTPSGQYSPIVRAHYRLLKDGVVIASGSRQGSNVRQITGLEVPGPGQYQIRVSLEDAAGNHQPANHAARYLRFDPTPPTQGELSRPTGWLGPRDLPHEQRWAKPESTPPSGVAGYVTVLDDVPTTVPPCSRSSITRPADATSEQLRALEEGTSWYHVRAVSGAGVCSEPRHVELRFDATPPVFGALERTTLRDGQVVRLCRSLTDPGPLSGVSERTVAPNVEMRPRAGGGWQQLAAEFASGKVCASWSAGSSPAGAYEVRHSGQDAAGNRARSESSTTVNPNRIGTTISAAIADRGQRRHKVPFGKRPPLTVELREADRGRPIAGEEIEVVEQFVSASRLANRVTRLRTAADGSARMRLAKGPRRTIEVRYAGSERHQPARPVTRVLNVTGHVTLSARRRVRQSDKFRFKGRIVEPRRDIRVDLLFFDEQRRRWRIIERTKTDPRGRYRVALPVAGRYTHPVTFLFRAVVGPGADRWPYNQPATSSRAKVIVVP